jgi:DNA-binding transcriptional ArsR family regulator
MKISRSAEGWSPSAGVWGILSGGQVIGDPNHLQTLDLIKEMLYNIFMDMFVALADPTRRTILEILASNGELSATDIYEHFPVSPQAVSQHLKVLREAKLVEMEKRAQKHLYRLNPHTLSQFEAWVQQMKQRWEERFSALDQVLESEKKKLVEDKQESR